jgi:NTP pyrophosphatase (non-canonical NTP hydrolase)
MAKQISPIDPKSVTLEELMEQSREVHELVSLAFPIDSENEALYARTLKLMEELGELANEILAKQGLQRQSKLDKHTQQDLEDEFGDVLLTVLMLGIELDLDVAEIMRRKFIKNFERMHSELEKQARESGFVDES